MKLSFFGLILVLFSGISSAEDAVDFDAELLFKGVTKQSSDYACGAAALSTLISGIVQNSHVTEADVMKEIKSATAQDKGYSLKDLMNASSKLGYYAEWQKVPKQELSKIDIPVLLLIGLNGQYPHFVILKGIIDNEAYIADSIRGNIRIPYDELIEQGINDKYKAWYVMAIEPSPEKPDDSMLYLSNDSNQRHRSHATLEQSNAITIVTLTKENQFILDYNVNGSLRTDHFNQLKIGRDSVSHALNARYGISQDTQLGAGFQYSDTTINTQSSLRALRASESSNNYSLYANHRIKLDSSGKANIILGINGLYSDKYAIFGGSFSAIGYYNADFAQLIAGASIEKDFSHNKLAKSYLPEYSYTGFIGLNKPIGDKFLATSLFSIADGKNKSNHQNTNTIYSVSAGLSYIATEQIQIKPSVAYSFGDSSEGVSFGLNITYVGGW